MQKARRRAFPLRDIALRLLANIRFQVLFHSPHRGTFHLSLAVLFTIGRWQIFSLGRWSSQIPTGLLVPCGTRGQVHAVVAFVYGGITLYAGTFQTLRLADSDRLRPPHNPEGTCTFGLGCSPFARHY